MNAVTKMTIAGFAALLLVNAAESAVYEVQLAVKTTLMKESKLGKHENVCNESGKIAYRKEATVKIKGLFWGSACDFDSGALFWNETCQKSYGTAFAWEFLNRIDASAQRAEGFCTLEFTDSTGDEAGKFWLSGFGAVKDPALAKAKDGGYEGDYSGAYVTSMSGSHVGWLYLGKLIKVTQKPCSRCEGGYDVEEVDVAAWALCSCDLENDSRTAAHGAWTMKYHEKASKAYDANGSIVGSYSFPKYVTVK